jgi:hypothetical protein
MPPDQPLKQNIQLRCLLSIGRNDTESTRITSASLHHSATGIPAHNERFDLSDEGLLATQSFTHRQARSRSCKDMDLEDSFILVPLDSPIGQTHRDVTTSGIKGLQHSKRFKFSIKFVFERFRSTLYEISHRVVDIDGYGDVLEISERNKYSGTTTINSSITTMSTFETSNSSFGCFDSSPHSQYAPHPDRRFMVRMIRRILYNASIQSFMLLLILLQTAILVVDTTEQNKSYRGRLFTSSSPWKDSCYLTIFFLYTVELICKCLVQWFGPGNAITTESRLSLRNLFNAFDLVAIISFWINFIMILAGAAESRSRQILAMLSVLRVLRLLRITVGTDLETRIIFEALKNSGAKLGKVASFICFFWLLFAVVGVQTFKSSLKRSCVLPNKDSVDMNTAFRGQVQFCGGYLENESDWFISHPWLKGDGSPGAVDHKGYLCPQAMVCQESVNPYNDTVSFDNIFQSLELVFVTFSANTFSTLMYNIMDSSGLGSAIFFAAVIVILYFWLLILLIGVITGSIQDIRLKLRTLVIAPDGNSAESGLRRTDNPKKRAATSFQRIFRKTKWFWIIMIAINLAAQAQRASWMSNSREAFINYAETSVTWILFSEIILRFVLEWRTFHHSKQNLTDLGLAIITSLMQIPSFQRAGRAYTWFTAFQIARSYRLFWAIGPVKELMVSDLLSTMLQLFTGSIDGIF